MVDSVSPDLKEQQKKILDRRTFLKALGATLGLIAVSKGQELLADSTKKEALPPQQSSLQQGQPLSPQPQIQPESLIAKEIAKEEKEKKPEVASSYEKKKDSMELVKELLFPKSRYLGSEKEEGLRMVGEQTEFYKEFYKDKAVGPKEIALKVHRLESVVEDVAGLARNDAKNLFAGDEMRQKQFQEALSFAAKLLPGLIFAESQGDPKRISSSGAIGLCQLMPKTIREYSSLLKITVPSKEEDFKKRFSEETMNIYLGLIHLARMFVLFPDPGIALWAYHLGEGEMGKKVVEPYTRSVIQKTVKDEKTQKEKIEGIDKVLRDKNKIGTAELMNEYGVNFIRVMNTEFITAQFKGKEHDSTLSYIKNVGAGLFFLQEYSS